MRYTQHRRRAADRRLRDRHGAAGRDRRSSRRAGSGPGEMHRRRPGRGQALPATARSRTCSPRRTPYGKWIERHHVDSTSSSSRHAPSRRAFARGRAAPPPARRRLSPSRIWRLILASRWSRTARKPSARWATTRRSRCCRDKYRGLHHFFRQNFSQVTNPPIDCLRERRVMSLKTRLRQSRQHPRRGPEPEPTCCSSKARSLTNAEFEAMRELHRRHRRRDRLHLRRPTAGPTPARTPSSASARRPRRRCAAAATHVVLTDEHVRRRPRADADDPGGRRACTPTWCARRCAPSPRSTCARRECLDVHYFAVLIGVGATTVNAYLARRAIADRHAPRPVRRA